MEIAGKRVLVVGGSGVLGGLIALGLTERGAAVILAGRDPARLEATAEDLGGVPTIRADLTHPESARALVGSAVERLGGLDGLVNAAGVVAFGSLPDHDDAVLDELMVTDLIAPLRIIREAAPHLDGGFVVNLTGVVAEQPVPGMAPYVAAKAGLSAATRALAKELRRRRILVIDARPPHTETGLAARPVAGAAPPFPPGLDPAVVAARVIAAVEADEREIPSVAF
jgi:cyclic-di-GMP-binding biofilm dispersal mediator protein